MTLLFDALGRIDRAFKGISNLQRPDSIWTATSRPSNKLQTRGHKTVFGRLSSLAPADVIVNLGEGYGSAAS